MRTANGEVLVQYRQQGGRPCIIRVDDDDVVRYKNLKESDERARLAASRFLGAMDGRPAANTTKQVLGS